MTNRIGWIGLGRMGEATARRLLQAGHGLSVWNRTRSKAEALAAHGAEVVDRKTDLAGCALVFTMVSTTDDLKEVLFGEGGRVAGARKPQAVVDIAVQLQELARGAGLELEPENVAVDDGLGTGPATKLEPQ